MHLYINYNFLLIFLFMYEKFFFYMFQVSLKLFFNLPHYFQKIIIFYFIYFRNIFMVKKDMGLEPPEFSNGMNLWQTTLVNSFHSKKQNFEKKSTRNKKMLDVICTFFLIRTKHTGTHFLKHLFIY